MWDNVVKFLQLSSQYVPCIEYEPLSEIKLTARLYRPLLHRLHCQKNCHNSVIWNSHVTNFDDALATVAWLHASRVATSIR